MCLGFCPPPPPHQNHHRGHTSSCFFFFFFNQFITSLHPGTTWSAKQRSHWDTRLCNISIFFMSVPQKIGHPSIFVLLYLYCLIAAAGGLMFFLSHFKDFFIWSRQWYIRFHQPWARKKHTQLYASLCCMDVFRFKNESGVGKVIQQSWFIQTEMERYIV